MYEFAGLTLQIDDLASFDWAAFEQDAATLEPTSLEPVHVMFALQTVEREGDDIAGIWWDDAAATHRMDETLLGEPAEALLRRLATADVARLKQWLSGEAFALDWQEGYGEGAELRFVGGGVLLATEQELSGGWMPVNEDEEREANLQENAHSTLSRLDHLGLLPRPGASIEPS